MYRSDPRDPILSYMILESFLVHVRNLFEFLFRQKELHGDEVRSAHFITDKENNKIWRTEQRKFEGNFHEEMARIHKRLAHISYDRDSCNSGWVKANLAREIRDMMRSFINHVPDDKKQWFNLGELLTLEFPQDGLEVVDSTS